MVLAMGNAYNHTKLMKFIRIKQSYIHLSNIMIINVFNPNMALGYSKHKLYNSDG